MIRALKNLLSRADCLYKENAKCIKNTPRDNICAKCRVKLIATDAQFSSINWQETNGFIMIEKSCHTCEYGIYENQEEVNYAVILTCEKMIEENHNGEIVDPKQYVCNLWKQGDLYRGC